MFQKVVAHYIDHEIIKGTSVDVDPSRPTCHIRTDDQRAVEVDLAQVKALYFVKCLEGDSSYDEEREPVAGDRRLRASTLIDLEFIDGERQAVLANRFPPKGRFFFVVPMDPNSNNSRILVNRDAVGSMQVREPEAGTSDPPKRRRRTSWVFDGEDIKYIDV